MTKRNGGVPLQSVINALNPLLRGFSYYFKIANASRAFKQLASWLRRRLRSIQREVMEEGEPASIAGYDSMVIKASSLTST